MSIIIKTKFSFKNAGFLKKIKVPNVIDISSLAVIMHLP